MNAKRELMSNSPVLPMQTIRPMAHLMSKYFGTVAGVHGAFDKMKTVRVDAGDEIVRHRAKEHQYYIILEGEAEVWKPDPETDIWSCVDRLAQGDAFGEEAILIGGFRNATVRMMIQGVLLVLDEDLFNSTLRSRLVQEVTPERAQVLAGRQDTEWLDCRFDIEYAEVRIPHARLICCASAGSTPFLSRGGSVPGRMTWNAAHNACLEVILSGDINATDGAKEGCCTH